MSEVGGEATTRILVRERQNKQGQREGRKKERERGGESGVKIHVKNAVGAVGIQMVVQQR